MKRNTPYWFHAKRYGWGWGLPSAWQGWVVFAAFLGLMIALPSLISPSVSIVAYIGAVTLAAGVLITICYLKGEPPKWRWGASEDKKN